MNDMTPVAGPGHNHPPGADRLSGTDFVALAFDAKNLSDAANIAYWLEDHGSAGHHRASINASFAALAARLGYRLEVL